MMTKYQLTVVHDSSYARESKSLLFNTEEEALKEIEKQKKLCKSFVADNLISEYANNLRTKAEIDEYLENVAEDSFPIGIEKETEENKTTYTILDDYCDYIKAEIILEKVELMENYNQ